MVPPLGQAVHSVHVLASPYQLASQLQAALVVPSTKVGAVELAGQAVHGLMAPTELAP